MSNLPHFGNLDRFASRCATLRGDNLSVSKTEAQSIVLEYKKLLAYVVELQGDLIAERERQATEIEIVTPEF